jgi:mRNA-degrading endonuclease toxin of MazEF toxin-antitoxin module
MMVACTRLPGGDGAAQLREVARRYRALALAHPHVVPLIVTRPLATPQKH